MDIDQGENWLRIHAGDAALTVTRAGFVTITNGSESDYDEDGRIQQELADDFAEIVLDTESLGRLIAFLQEMVADG